MNQFKTKAFTLVELIVVITILAILGTIAFISLQGYSRDARDSTRLSDIKNIEISLELFSSDTGKYPKPDNYNTISYLGSDVRYQGVIGDNVTVNLQQLNKKPVDPLLGTEYIYSATNTQKEYEVLALYEGDNIAFNMLISQTYAADVLVPKIEGTYNQVFVKTPTHIIPTPSIITSEDLNGTLILDNTNIKSQVVNGQINIPGIGGNISQTGVLTISLSVYTGSIDENSTAQDKEDVVDVIQAAYIGSNIATKDDILYILNQTTSEQKQTLVNNIILNNPGGAVSPNIVLKTVSDCGTTIGEIIYGTVDGTDIGLTCDNNIVVCNGTTGSGYTLSACNLGAIEAGTGTASYGGLFQWGNNYDFRDNQFTNFDQYSLSIGVLVDTSIYGPGNYYSNSNFFSSGALSTPYDWSSPQNNNLWGENDNTSISRQGPCISGYHIPSYTEWLNLYTIGGWGSNGISMSNTLKMPFAGNRSWGDARLDNQGSNGYYWTSSSSVENAYVFYLNSSTILSGYNNRRASGYSIRCFAN